MMQTRINIEQLTSFSQKDAESIKELAAKLGKSTQNLTDDDIKEIISSPTTHLIVAREPKEQKIVGMATLAVYRIPYVKKAYFDDFIVLDEYQGQGIGSSLLKTVLSLAQDLGAKYIDFTSTPERIEANKLYEKFGFKKRNTNVYRLAFNHDKTQ
ncbi:MAG TPA: GNAT family N-acetyltransferase [Candidatus Saccharimonadales bacterium]|nr:GNAT family N-acetyltransferase [Candidatus Saccharimonadales bacterium]